MPGQHPLRALTTGTLAPSTFRFLGQYHLIYPPKGLVLSLKGPEDTGML